MEDLVALLVPLDLVLIVRPYWLSIYTAAATDSNIRGSIDSKNVDGVAPLFASIQIYFD